MKPFGYQIIDIFPFILREGSVKDLIKMAKEWGYLEMTLFIGEI
jgi:hypothetical protein